jgi:uncharacterized protein
MPDPPDDIAKSLRSLHKRLGQLRLNPDEAPAPQPAAPVTAPSARRIIRAGVPIETPSDHPAWDLPAGEEQLTPDGEHAFVIREPIGPRSGEWARLPALLQGQVPEDALFMDIETTGLAPTVPLFLIGAMSLESDGLVVHQFLARDYDEERAAIALYLQHAADRSKLITFNGRSFDVPFIQTRAAANRLRANAPEDHWDLLLTARQTWGKTLPDCKLQTLERHLLGRERHGDIPGKRVPEAYHDFVETGTGAEMAQILEHNLQDLVTMAELVVKLEE